ncbi:hypothetical protein ACN47E_005089 [Coniothyrium glycines]
MKSDSYLIALFSYVIIIIAASAAKDTKKVHHPYDYKIELSKAKHNLGYQDSPPHHLKRSAQQDEHTKLDTANNANSPDDDPVDDPLTVSFLPPAWSPSSTLESPYPPSGITPWNDSGRSQILDNEPTIPMWRTCPAQNLDCSKCPRDQRCKRPAHPWWETSSIHNVEDALADPTRPLDSSASAVGEQQETCPLSQCNDASPFQACGKGSRCVRNHCVCNRGFKSSATGATKNVRGYLGLQAVTVWVDPEWGCDTRCDDWSCKEVEQVPACFPVTSKDSGNVPWHGAGVTGDDWGGDQLGLSSVGSGAIRVPGANVAESSAVGQAT